MKIIGQKRSRDPAPGTVTLENIRRQRFSRNPIMARVFTAFDWVRELNEGVDKIYQEMDDAGLPEPEYENQDDYYLKLTLRNNLEERIPRLRNALAQSLDALGANDLNAPHGNGAVIEASALLSLMQRELEVYRLASSHGRVTPNDIVSEIGVSRRTASGILKKLATRGLLEWHGTSLNDPSQFYTAKQISQ